MFNILIADDEKIVRESYKTILKDHFSSKAEITLVKSGKEAIDACYNNYFDLILMDINMPGIKGIEAIEEIKKRNKDTVFIIISAYDNFKYAKSAITLDVYEYILKPVKRSMLIEVVQDAIYQIEDIREKRDIQLKYREKIERVVPAIEANFIYTVMSNLDFGDNYTYYSDILDISEEGGFILILEFLEENNKNIIDKLDRKYEIVSLYMYFMQKIKEVYKCIIGPILDNKVMIYFPSNPKSDKYFEKAFSISVAENVQQIITERSDIKIKIGIGNQYLMEEANNSYSEATKSLLSGSETINHISDYKEKDGSVALVENEEKLVNFVLKGNIEKSKQAFSVLFDNLSKNNKSEYVIEIFSVLYFNLNQKGINVDKIFNRNTYIKEIFEINDRIKLKNWALGIIEKITDYINRVIGSDKFEIINEALEFIKSNYSEQIFLENLARKMYISPQYLSRLIKENTGKSFSDYLIEVRLTKAKELLAYSDMSIKEISYEVSYQDPNYFSRLFKKYEKITPKDYRNQMGE